MSRSKPRTAPPRRAGPMVALLALMSIALPRWSAGEQIGDAAAIPHVGEQAREAYHSDFLQSDPHRAFAIAPGGVWSWVSGMSTTETAVAGALEACQKHSEAKCVIYATDDRVVFDEKNLANVVGAI